MIHFHLFFTLHILHMEPTLYYQSRHSFQPQKNSCRRAQKGNSKIISSWHQQANPIKKFQLPHFSEPSYLPFSNFSVHSEILGFVDAFVFP